VAFLRALLSIRLRKIGALTSLNANTDKAYSIAKFNGSSLQLAVLTMKLVDGYVDGQKKSLFIIVSIVLYMQPTSINYYFCLSSL
jgi:hypothetical protein